MLVLDNGGGCEVGLGRGFEAVKRLGREGGGCELWGELQAGDGALVDEESVHGVWCLVREVAELPLAGSDECSGEQSV